MVAGENQAERRVSQSRRGRVSTGQCALLRMFMIIGGTLIGAEGIYLGSTIVSDVVRVSFSFLEGAGFQGAMRYIVALAPGIIIVALSCGVAAYAFFLQAKAFSPLRKSVNKRNLRERKIKEVQRIEKDDEILNIVVIVMFSLGALMAVIYVVYKTGGG